MTDVSDGFRLPCWCPSRWAPAWRLHIQISVNLEKRFLRISFIRKIAVTWMLARAFAYLPSFFPQILDLVYWTVLISGFYLFWIAWHWKPAITTDLFNILTVLVEPPMTSSLSSFAKKKNVNICNTKKRYSKNENAILLFLEKPFK